jgi:hypothetical protein
MENSVLKKMIFSKGWFSDILIKNNNNCFF